MARAMFVLYVCLQDIEFGDISKRLELKKKAVHDFGWYLRNIYPELGLYDNDTYCWGEVSIGVF